MVTRMATLGSFGAYFILEVVGNGVNVALKVVCLIFWQFGEEIQISSLLRSNVAFVVDHKVMELFVICTAASLFDLK